ncbi:MAG: sigma-54-dependent Fis family transcriptional regulator [Myxococcales bacterium]|nr:sigma-54-dependent Fis family transcriptional regulator [Myxococcales bacterium]
MTRETTLRDDFRSLRRSTGASRPPLALLVAASSVGEAVGDLIDLDPERPTVIERVVRGREEDSRMSRFHATVRVAPTGDSVEVTDGSPRDGTWAPSANGVWTGGERLDGRRWFEIGERFITGRTLWMVVSGAARDSRASELHGVSPAIEHARREVELVASHVALRLARTQRVTQALLVTGARGTGKQVVAREAARVLADKRGRKDVPFRQVAAPALADGTAAADLFGVVDRYATDVRARSGFFEQAQGGVLFLDEVGDTPVSEQAKLLGVLQEREVIPLGGKTPVQFDCLVVAATNRDLAGLTRTGGFRDDLYDRLARFTVHLPGLDERPEDIPVIVHALLARHGFSGEIDPDVVDDLISRAWPGNVRELESVLERAIAVAEVEGDGIINREVISRSATRTAPGSVPVVTPAAPGPTTRSGMPSRAELLAALEATGWNKTEVGHRYGKHPRQVSRWMSYLGLEKPV